jgi:putative membrane protein
MKKLVFVALATMLCSSGLAFAAIQQAFITRAMQGNLAEVQMGKLAQQKGATQQARSFGQMLTNDHQANQRKADQVAKQVGVTPPTSPSAMQRSDYNRLSKLSGAAFDRKFAAMMVEGHRKTISEFRREARMNDAVGQYAKQTLPTLEKHLRAAERLEHVGRTAAR